MENENVLNCINVSLEDIKIYVSENYKAQEITCLVPKEDEATVTFLKDEGFRYIGKRLVENEIVMVYKLFNGLTEKYEDMASFFNRRATDYDLHMSDLSYYETSLIELVLNIQPTSEKITILDLGCGTGAELKYIFEKAPNAQVLCMDISEGMLEKLHDTYKENSKNIETVCGSYLGVDFGVNKYNYVIACNTLHHILKEDKLIVYKNIIKALKPKGIMLISDYIVNEEEENQIRAKYLEIVNSGFLNANKIYHIDIPLSSNSEKELLEATGFASIRMDSFENGDIRIIATK